MRFILIPLGSVIVSAFVSSASAAIMGHWRFEDGAFYEDSSGNGLTLGISGTEPVATAVPTSGVGSDFPLIIPLTGETNGQFAAFSGGHLTHADHASLSVTTQLTVEFYFNVTTMSGDAEMIVSQFKATNGDRSWFVAVQSNQIRFGTSETGTGNINQNSAFAAGNQVQTGVDYYGAVVYNAGVATFYLQNLTSGGSLQTSVIRDFAPSLNDTTADLNIGAYSNNSGYRFVGAIDEIRLSNTALTQEQLLISVPEPSALGLALIGTVALARRRRS